MKIMRVLRVVLAVFPLLFMGQTMMAQSTTTLNLAPGSLTPEQTALNQAIAEANGSPVDVIRVLEAHLRKYPDTERRAELEATIYKYAIDLNDKPRIILYGEKMLANNTGDQIEILDRTLYTLLASDDTEAAMKALVYAKQYEAAVKEKQARDPEGHATAAQWANLAERAMARATVLEARADGNLGLVEQALAAARLSWSISPSAEAAQEIGHWLVKLGREAEAIDWYADAVMIDDTGFPWTARDGDKKTAGELYVKVHGNDQGLGDVFLRAWDQSAAAIRERTARYKAMDPNFGLTGPVSVRADGTGRECNRGGGAGHGEAEGQDAGDRFLGDMVRAVHCTASDYRGGEAEICHIAGRGFFVYRFRRRSHAGEAVSGSTKVDPARLSRRRAGGIAECVCAAYGSGDRSRGQVSEPHERF